MISTWAGHLLSSSSAFSPAELFASGEQGAWYDPSDLTSMWQDSAGTTPAAVNSPVGKLDDKSGRGNHLTQATTAAKPILRQSGALYWLEFDGVDDKLGLASAAFGAADKMSIFCAVSHRGQVSASSWYELLSSPAAVVIRSFESLSASNSLIRSIGYANTVAEAAGNRTESTITPPRTLVFSTQHDIGGDLTTTRLDKIAAPNATGDKGVGTFGNMEINVGKANFRTTSLMDLHGLIIRVALTTDPTPVEDYLAGKQGRTL